MQILWKVLTEVFNSGIIYVGHIVLILSKGALIMKCILCAKEIHGEKVKWLNESSPLCEKCAALTEKQEETVHEYAHTESEKNKTGVIIQTVAKVIWILGAIAAIIAAIIAFYVSGVISIASLISYLFVVFVSGFIVYGLGEIIILLGQINDKIPNKRK